jgi:hypothetical protein
LDPSDDSPEASERIADALDEEAASLAGLRNDNSVVTRLSSAGLLPSDLYEIRFDPQLAREVPGWDLDKCLAEVTIRNPHREQQISHVDRNGFSLFARFFEHKFPARSFWFLVTGLRDGTVLHVQQVFKIYPQDVDLSGCHDLLCMLKAFAEHFGVEAEFNGHRGKVFEKIEVNGHLNIHRIKLKQGNYRALISGVGQVLGEGTWFSFVFVMNWTAYRQAVESRHGWDIGLSKEVS